MYEKYFDLKTLPFENTPNPDFFFMGHQYRETLALMIHRVTSQKGVLCIAGPVGCGKTTLATTLTARMPKGSLIIPIAHPKTTPEELKSHIAGSIGITQLPNSNLELSARIKEKLTEISDAGQLCLLIIDEAQFMSTELFQEVLVLSNFETRHAKLIQILLLGQLELLESLNRPEMRQLMQRISVTKVLKPMDKKQSIEYIKHRMRIGGGFPEVFSPEALNLVATYSGGIPRVINNLCDAALLKVFVSQKNTVEAQDIEASVADLGLDLSAALQECKPVDPKASTTTFSEKLPYKLSTGMDPAESSVLPESHVQWDLEEDGPTLNESPPHPNDIGTDTPMDMTAEELRPTSKFITGWSVLAIILILICFIILWFFQQKPNSGVSSKPAGSPSSKITIKNLDTAAGKSKLKPLPQPEEPRRSTDASKQTPISGGSEKMPLHGVEHQSLAATSTGPDVGEDFNRAHITEEEPKETAPVTKRVETQNASDEITGPSVLQKINLYPFSIYTGAYRTIEKAETALADLREKDLNPYWVKVSLKKGVWYRVFLGVYKDAKSAEAVIESRKLIGAEVKHTRYAAFIDTLASQDEVAVRFRSLSELGYSPYTIREGALFHLFIGAFYTRIGAESLYHELISKGIRCQVVER